MQPSLGRVLHYRLPERWAGDSRWRVAIVACEPFTGGEVVRCNLTVLLDGLNDLRDGGAEKLAQIGALHGTSLSIGSAVEGDGEGCWRWPPRVA